MIVALANEIEINTNILETNIINILILLGLIIYVGKGFVTNSVDLRRRQILKSLETLDNNLNEASSKFIESTKQLEQINLIISHLEEDNQIQKINSLNRKYEKIIDEVNFVFQFLILTLNRNRLDALLSIEKFFLSFSIGKVLNKCSKLNDQEQEKILDKLIFKFKEAK